MVRSKDELMSALKDRIGEDTSDEAISILEDVADTLDDYATKTADSTDWKSKYDELDEGWRKRYRDRFYSASGDNEQHDEEKDEQLNDQTEQITSYEELFTEEV